VYQTLLGDGRLHELLFLCDRDLALEARRGGCPVCGGRVDQANYPRKPRGLPGLPGIEWVRLSFCCAALGCRRRLLPPSVRFLGRRVYHAAVMIVTAAVGRQGGRARRLLRERVGVSVRTVARWRRWWRTGFAQSRFWRAARGRFTGQLRAASLPHVLLGRFPGDAPSRLIALLRFLSPITTASGPECAGFLRHPVAPRPARRRRAVQAERSRD
jgi:hypothetical protein